MTQITFSAATTPQLTDLDANFTELYGKTTALTGATGRVGINKTPTAGIALDVNGYGVFGQTGSGFDVIDVTSTNSVAVRMAASGNSSIASLGTTSNHPVYFMTNNAERVRIDTSGNLLMGIAAAPGANNPANGVAVVGPTAATAILTGHASGSISGSYYATYSYNAAIIGSITQSGTTAVLYNTTSDQRLKENITNAMDAGTVLDSVQVRQFDWKADGSHQRFGFIAQELVMVVPEAVHS